MGYEELKIEGRNAVLEAFRSGKTIDKLFVLDGCQDGPVRTCMMCVFRICRLFLQSTGQDLSAVTERHTRVFSIYPICLRFRT